MGRLAVVGLGVGGGGGVEGEGVGFFDEFGGAVVVDVVPGLRGARGGDGEPSGKLDALGGGGGLAVVAVLEHAGPIAGEGCCRSDWIWVETRGRFAQGWRRA